MRAIKSVHRAFRQGFRNAYVKPSRWLKQSTGRSTVRIRPGLGQDRVLVQEYLPPEVCNGYAARRVCSAPVHSALQRACPGSRTYDLLDDDDPSGFKHPQGPRAKMMLASVPPMLRSGADPETSAALLCGPL